MQKSANFVNLHFLGKEYMNETEKITVLTSATEASESVAEKGKNETTKDATADVLAPYHVNSDGLVVIPGAPKPMTPEHARMYVEYGVRPDVLNADDIMRMVPKLAKHPKLVHRLMKFLSLDHVNATHGNNCTTPGPDFVRGLLHEFDIPVDIENAAVWENLPKGAFITVSNHHFGALDGIILIDLIAQKRPKFRVMVNMFLSYISGMRPNFIAVDAHASADPKKKAISMQGIKEAIKQVRAGEPVGFFPAGAVGKVNWRGRLKDRQWQPNIIRLIQQLKVPVVPIFFHGSQSWFFNFLGVACWQLRTLRHPAEVFRKSHKRFRVTFGDPIPVEQIVAHSGSLEELRDFLRHETYKLRDEKNPAWKTVTIEP